MKPIYDMLKAYTSKKTLPFHMPGHILGRGLFGDMRAVGNLDITEIPGSDCLHYPQGVIKESQELASKCFGSDYSLFLVNGSTSGIHAMIQAALKPGDKLILGRDCHISALNALAQLNCEPVFVLPQIENNIPLGITPQALEKAIEDNPDARGILITRPGYYGTATSLNDIVKLAKTHKIPLLVDEAHGAHFKFHNNLPQTAMDAGADLCVQSLHKTLPAFTQTAILHGKSNGIIPRSRIEKTVSMVQTTSPSYLLMASIDIARDMMENQGKSLYEGLYQTIKDFDKKLNENTIIRRISFNTAGFESDFSRIVLSFESTSLSGFMAEELLRTRFGIVAEMADFNNLVLIATPFHTSEDFDKLLSSLEIISREYKRDGEVTQNYNSAPPPWPGEIPERVIPLRKALFDKCRILPINKAVGEISGAFVTPYPPGIPVICPGERITDDIAEYINLLLQRNQPVHGINNGYIEVI